MINQPPSVFIHITEHAFERAQRRMAGMDKPTARAILSHVLPNLDLAKYQAAPDGHITVRTPDYLFLLSKVKPTLGALITIVDRRAMKGKTKLHYMGYPDVSRDILQQMAEDK